jgi:trigger factor
MPGFRKGKVPRSVLEREYGEDVHQQVLQEVLEEACVETLAEHEIEAVGNPLLLSHNLSEAMTLTFEAQVEVKPAFDLAKYKSLEMVCRVVRVDEEHLDAALKSLRERAAVLQTEEDRVNVCAGDVIVFDMYAFAEGEPIDSASGEGIQLEVGSGRFPEEFEKQLAGVTRGIRTPIDVHFPAEHGDAELAGKLVRFQVTVREIKNKILPNLDDDFAHEIGYEDCGTLAELRGKIRGELEAHARADAERRARNELITQVVDAHSFDVPQALVERQVVDTLREMGVRDLPEERIEEVRSALEPGAIKQVRARFILEAIAAAEALEVADDELESEINRQVAGAGAQGDRAREYFSRPGAKHGLRANMLRDKALARVVELSTRRDVEVDESQVADHEGSS